MTNEEYKPVAEQKVSFRQLSDLMVWQVLSRETKQPLAVISGYNLRMDFDMSYLKSVEDIEACLAGLSKIFREIIMEKIMEDKPQEP